jgi:hypothetical protein
VSLAEHSPITIQYEVKRKLKASFKLHKELWKPERKEGEVIPPKIARE